MSVISSTFGLLFSVITPENERALSFSWERALVSTILELFEISD
jgi:hypothetical protein